MVSNSFSFAARRKIFCHGDVVPGNTAYRKVPCCLIDLLRDGACRKICKESLVIIARNIPKFYCHNFGELYFSMNSFPVYSVMNERYFIFFKVCNDNL